MWNHLTGIQTLKSKLPINIKVFLIRILVFFQEIFYFKKENPIEGISSEKRKVFLLLSTDYSNLGDHGMTYAQRKMLERECPDAEIIEVLVGDTLKVINQIKKNIKPGDVLTLKGGGNIGIEYFREELYRRKIIKSFPNNRIIIFPQTVFFPNTNLGKKEFINTIECYKKNQNLNLFVRDQESFDKVQGLLFNEVVLVPDVVQSLPNIKNSFERNGVLLCMRADVEGNYSNNQKDHLLKLCSHYFTKVQISDTTTKYNISLEMRENELFKIWNQMLKSEVIITDRLHGMIFAAITQTPCIVFNTYNHKLSGQYRWLKHLDYIRFIEFKDEEISKHLDDIINNKVEMSERNMYEEKFNQIILLLK